MSEKFRPEVKSRLRQDLSMIQKPEIIREASGIIINGQLFKSFIYSTDVATIAYTNADGVLAVYPFTPSANIIQAIRTASQVSVLAGVGGGVTSGSHSANMAMFAESIGAIGVVVNAQTTVETLEMINEVCDIPIVYTVISEYTDIEKRLKAGVQILNVSGGRDTAELVRKIRKSYPTIPIIATGGRKEDHILETIQAGANAITFTPASSSEIFQAKMETYRDQMDEKYIDSDFEI